ncbi:MAG: glycerol-3-phosphate dehydrogenase/oxidase [Candidatus Competibacteraceae bacterium]|nr:glycerol-3-phosphate dehydrogenase/oxidase [Candidatus Competibacteraceae bacterium]
MQLRTSHIEQLSHHTFDALIIGGGINGAVSAAALAGRGVKTALIDKGDFAGFTSMHSSNLVWGGIKYMESYDFGLVRKLCLSRNQLLRNYPSSVQEIRFFATIAKGFRYPPFLLYLGTWLYWLIGNGYTRIPRLLSKPRIHTEEPIVNTDDAVGGFEYSDAYLYDNDARFVFNFVRTALDRGCVAANYLESLGGQRIDGYWHIRVRDVINGREFIVRAKVLINAAGPFADQHNHLTDQTTAHHHVFSKGIHLIVRQLTPHRRVLSFFADDGRLFFVIPMGGHTCIGTTDTRVEQPETQVTDEDIDFVLNNINKRVKLDRPLGRDDIIATRCGVRPLAVETNDSAGRDFLQLSRKHAIDADLDTHTLSIFGGKLTDCINVGDEVCDLVRKMDVAIPYPNFKWYGEPPAAVREEFFHRARLMELDKLTVADATEPLSVRLWRRYGAKAMDLLALIGREPQQAEILIEGTEFTRCEMQYAARHEMITKLEDLLRRRTKIALVVRRKDIKQAPGLMEACDILFGAQAQEKFDDYFRSEESAESASFQPDRTKNPQAHSQALNWK